MTMLIGTHQLTDELADKAVRLVEANRVVLVPRRSFAYVAGLGGTYRVTATRDGVRCNCTAGHNARYPCSHSVAAMIAWAEAGR